MKDVLTQADRIIPDNQSHLVSLYRGYLALQQDEDPGQGWCGGVGRRVDCDGGWTVMECDGV